MCRTAPYWSSRGYQNIVPERVITMTRGVIKDINSGRRRAKETRRKKKEKAQSRERQSGEKGWEKKTNRLLYAALRTCPLTALDSLSKDFNRQQTKRTSIHRPMLIIRHLCPSLLPFISSNTLTHTHTSTQRLFPSKFNTLIWLRTARLVIDAARGLIHLEPKTRL